MTMNCSPRGYQRLRNQGNQPCLPLEAAAQPAAAPSPHPPVALALQGDPREGVVHLHLPPPPPPEDCPLLLCPVICLAVVLLLSLAMLPLALKAAMAPGDPRLSCLLGHLHSLPQSLKEDLQQYFQKLSPTCSGLLWKKPSLSLEARGVTKDLMGLFLNLTDST